LDGQVVSLEPDPSQGERDIYGRMLAFVWLPDGRNFGEVMIADGFAHEYTYDKPYAYIDAFRAAQEFASANHTRWRASRPSLRRTAAGSTRW
jgi:micrococcal nuclease